MSIGLGHLRMPPAVFWSMTLPEFFAAMDGYLEAKGVKRKPLITKTESDALFAQFDENGLPLNGNDRNA